MQCLAEEAALRRLSALSPAKINLFFRILHKREDGFHEVVSLYQAINLFDRIDMQRASVDRFTCNEGSLETQDNLILRAVQMFREKTKWQEPLHIHLDKHIPIEAGLGGGSSNAATALLMLCKLANIQLSLQELVLLGRELGSDVPFFFTKGTALGRGRGNELEEMEALPLPSLWIVKPQFGLSTKAVYAAFKLDALSYRDVSHDLASYKQGNVVYYNDLEQAAFTIAPELHRIYVALQTSGFRHVVLSGSGTAFFCIGDVDKCYPALTYTAVQPIRRKEDLLWTTVTSS